MEFVKKFKEYIEEGLWSKGLERAQSGDIRREQGKKVHTSIGVDIVLQDPSCDYEEFIKQILDNINDSPFGFYMSFIKKNKDEKSQFEISLNDNTFIRFSSYDQLIVSNEIDEDDLSIYDYISIITGITERLKEINLVERLNSKKNGKIIYDEYIQVLTKEQVLTIMEEQGGDNKDYWEEGFLEKFQDSLIREFNDNINIYLEDNMVEMKLNYESLSHYDDIMIYTKEYFYDELGNWDYKHMNESLWSKGLERAQSGEERIEDKVDSNIDELKEIDLGFDFVFADKNLEINGESLISYNDVKNYIDYIKKHGWRLMTKDEAQTASKLSPEHDDILFQTLNYEVNACLKNSDEKLRLPLVDSRYTDYMLDGLTNNDYSFVWVLTKYKKYATGRFSSCGITGANPNSKIFIRLVKDKKSMNEGLWSKGLERAQTAKRRLGDFTHRPETRDELQDAIGELVKEWNGDGVLDLNSIDTSKVVDMNAVFALFPSLKKIDISKWDTSNVENMQMMFYKCYEIDCGDLSKWDVSKVTHMNHMFYDCKNFNSDLSNWKTNSLLVSAYMFALCEKFNSDISRWDMSNVTNIQGMFYDCVSFNQNLDTWDVSRVEDMQYTFRNCVKMRNHLPVWFKGNINEGLWSKGLERAQSGEIRVEDGKKVKTKLGPEIVIQNINCPYDKIIKQICNSSNWGQYPYKIYDKYMDTKVLKSICDGEIPNWFNLPNIKGYTIKYPDYDELEPTPENLTEGDYYSLLKAIMESVNSTEYLVDGYKLKFVIITRQDSNRIKQRLIDDDDQEYGDYIFNDFKDKFYDKLPQQIAQNISVSMTDNMEIIIDFNYYTLLNYAKIVNWSKRFFKI